MAALKVAVRRDPTQRPSRVATVHNGVPLPVVVPESIRRQAGLISAEHGENLRIALLRGLRTIRFDIPKSELVDRRGRQRQG